MRTAGAGTRLGLSSAPTAAGSGEARARRLASRISLAATALMAAYVRCACRRTRSARFYAVIAVLATYIIVRRIATRLAMEFLPQ